MSQCPSVPLIKRDTWKNSKQYNNKKRKVLLFIGTVGHFDLINCFYCIKSVHTLFLLWDYWDTGHYFVRMKLHPHEFVAPTL
jgi:hypothetical protein